MTWNEKHKVGGIKDEETSENFEEHIDYLDYVEIVTRAGYTKKAHTIRTPEQCKDQSSNNVMEHEEYSDIVVSYGLLKQQRDHHKPLVGYAKSKTIYHNLDDTEKGGDNDGYHAAKFEEEK